VDRAKIFKTIEEIEVKIKEVRGMVEIAGETLGVVLEAEMIQ